MTELQKNYIEGLRTKLHISPDTLDAVCMHRYGVAVSALDVRTASELIDALKEGEGIKREVQVVAGQASLFGDVA